MDSISIAAASGIRSRMQALDLMANNLANAATAGYKKDQEFYGLFTSDLADETSFGSTPTLPVVQRQWTDFSPGPLQTTGSPLDIALSGSGFFAVNGPNGTLYTRNGALRTLQSGELATVDGYPVRGAGGKPIKIDPNKDVEIATDGTVRQDGQSVGVIEVAQFASTTSLAKVAASYFENTDLRNPPVPTRGAQILQGRIEGSNVPVAEAAMRLVGVMRQFEMLQKAIGVTTEMGAKALQDIARVTP